MAVLMLRIMLIISGIDCAYDLMWQLEDLHENQKRMVTVLMWYTVLVISAIDNICTATMQSYCIIKKQ